MERPPHTPASAAAIAALVAIVGLTLYFMFDEWFGSFVASVILIVGAAAAAWFTYR